MNLLSAISGLLGGHSGQKTVQFGPGSKGPVQHAALSPDQVQANNAQIAADGAKMYQTAHPGKTYQLGQNGETYNGGVDMALYQKLLGGAPGVWDHLKAPAPQPIMLQRPQTTQLQVPGAFQSPAPMIIGSEYPAQGQINPPNLPQGQGYNPDATLLQPQRGRITNAASLY